MRDTILFDFGGTLDADGDRWAVRFHRAYADVGGRVPLAEFEPLFREADRRMEADAAVRTMGFRAMITAQAALLGTLVPDARGIAQDDAAARFYRHSLRIIGRDRALLEGLATRYRLGVVSNFTGNLDRCLAELDLLRLFSGTADSLLVGFAKPDPRLFLHALATIETRPEAA